MKVDMRSEASDGVFKTQIVLLIIAVLVCSFFVLGKYQPPNAEASNVSEKITVRLGERVAVNGRVWVHYAGARA